MTLRLFPAVLPLVATLLAAYPLPVLAQQTAPTGTAAIAPKAAQDFIKQLSDKAFAVLRNKSLKQADRDQQFRTLLREGFALDIIGNAVLGNNRRTATPVQLQNFNAAFPDYVIRIYASRLTDYSDTNVTVKDTVPAGNRGDMTVRTMVSGKNVSQPVSADWRVRNIPGVGLRIVDLSIEGVSMVITQRDEFNARIQAKGLDSLIADIKSGKATAATAKK